MKKDLETCGFGKKRKTHFGNTFDSFYKENSPKNTFLTPEIKKCLSIIYSPEDASYNGFGSKKNKSISLKEINKYIKYIKSLK
jgi:hypothetical protein